ncbi:MAG: NAD-dependent epimerase/dehydratase family protein [Actinobacteria bacterium]|nr:MAG: NAD-dependent epimerase/dehydratase family protein [Actinomycetota bacterium]
MATDVTRSVRADCLEVLEGRASQLSDLRGAHLAVTGGTGFMGSWIAELVCALNHEYGFGVELTLVARRARTFRERHPHIARESFVRLVDADVRDVFTFAEGTNVVVHAAGSPDNRSHATDPIGTMSAIGLGTHVVLEAAERLRDLNSLLLVSSGLVYGAQPEGLERIPETFVGGPAFDSVASAYAEAKRFAESLGYAHRVQTKLPVVFARPFAFIGPYQGLDKPWAVNNFLRDALLGGPIRILGDPGTRRSYLYPSDMAFWLLRIACAGTPGDAYNVGSDEAVQLGELAELIARVQGGVDVTRRPGGFRNASDFVPDVTKAALQLGLRRTVDLSSAVERTLESHRADFRAGAVAGT